MAESPPFTAIVRDLPVAVPFVGPETLERDSGRPIRVRVGANESAFGISPAARTAMAGALERVSWYNDPEGFDLRQALARRHGVEMDQVCLGAGIDELLGVTVRLCVEAGEAVVASHGSYPTFVFHVNGFGGRLQAVPYREDCADLEALAAEARRCNAKLLYLANPDNPMGTWHKAGAIEAMLEAVPPECAVILDEAYSDFAPPGTGLSFDGRFPNLVRMRTFSKAHGMAGARIGYVVGEAGFIAAFDKVRNHFGVNRVAQAGALASLGDEAFVAGVVEAVEEGRAEYVRLAAEHGLKAVPSATNFVSIDMGGGGARARAMLAALLRRDVFVRMPAVAPLDRCIRVSVGTPAERVLFAGAFAEALAEIRQKGA